jgi:long-chain acyl-CoA synthetase
MATDLAPTKLKVHATKTTERLGPVLAAAAADRASKPALRMKRNGAWFELTYGELLARAQSGGARLRELGVEPGDRVALLSENRPEWGASYLAILEAEATAVPLDAQLNESDVRALLERAEARVLIASPAIAAKLSSTRDHLRARGIPVLDLERALAPFEGSAERCDPRPASALDDHDPTVASLIFTSGTTALPKGVLLTHENILFDMRAGNANECLFRRDDRLVSVLPLHHVFEFGAGFYTALHVGATITYVESLRGDVIAETMRAAQPTTMLVVPRLLELFLAGIERKAAARGRLAKKALSGLVLATRAGRAAGIDLSRRLLATVHEGFGGRLRRFITGGAPLALETREALEALGFEVLEGYGLTETSPVVARQRPGESKPGTVGTLLEGLELRIVAPDSKGVGEIAVRGPNVMRGYFRDPEATRASVRDGWFHTGDLGRLDRDHHLVITGRVKELIVTAAGKKVTPNEVEARYGEIPGIAGLCVCGTRAGSHGEVVGAAVQIDGAAFPGANEEEKLRAVEERLLARAEAARIPSYMRIQFIQIVDDLPKTATLKLKRHEVRARLEQTTRPETVARAEPGDAPAILELVRSRNRARFGSATLDSTLAFDLAIDSLERLDLVAAIEERFGVALAEGVVASVHRVRDLASAIEVARATSPAGQKRDKPAAAPVPPPRGLASLALLGAFGRAASALYGLSVQGLANVPRGPVIFCPNHESHFDIFFVASALPKERRRDLVCFGKREHFEALGTRLFATVARAIPIDRDGDIRAALRAGSDALAQGRSLLIHPEGTRTKTGALGPFRAGAALLALERSVPIVPVKIAGAFAIYPESRRLPRLADWRHAKRLRLEVRFGPSIVPEPGTSDPTRAAAELTERLRASVAAL